MSLELPGLPLGSSFNFVAMGKLKEYADRLRGLTEEQIRQDLADIVKTNEATVVDLNISQMLQGIDAKGNPIEPPYSELTVEIKKKKGQPSDRVTLHDEGDFQSAMYLVGDKFPFNIDSKDKKTARLQAHYDGNDLFGLTPKSQNELNQETIKEDTIQYFKNLLLP